MKDFIVMWICGTVCALLGMAAGRYLDAQKSSDLEPAVVDSQVDTLSDWQVLEMAIAFTESRFREDAIGKADDTGVLQIRPIYVEEVNRLTGRDYTIADAFNADMSLEMFNLMQDARNPGRDIDEAIRLHNKSPYYRKVVLENMELIRRAEEMRRKIINFGE